MYVAPDPSPRVPLEAEYELLEELGRGGMAVVYRARSRIGGGDVAIKVLRGISGAQDEAVLREAAARLAREAQTGAALRHPNVVPTLAVLSLPDGGIAIVMPLVRGRTLRAVLHDDGAFSIERARAVVRDLAAALDHVHRHGIVHRDLKPDNIFLDERRGSALLSDFGIARSRDHDTSLTQTGVAIGTPTYMAPEQVDGGTLDGRSDLYALGLIGWEMLSGRRPWEGESLYSVIYKQKHESLPRLHTIRDDLPDDLQYIIEQLTQKSPAERLDSAAALLDALDQGPAPRPFRRWRQERGRRRVRPDLAAALDRDAQRAVLAERTVQVERARVLPVPLRMSRPSTRERAAETEALLASARRDEMRAVVVSVLVVLVLIASFIAGAIRLARPIGSVDAAGQHAATVLPRATMSTAVHEGASPIVPQRAATLASFAREPVRPMATGLAGRAGRRVLE